jgi:C-terminal peptidase prc
MKTCRVILPLLLLFLLPIGRETPQGARPLPAAGEVVPAQVAAAPEEEEDEEEKYWEGVEFGEEHFDEVIEYVKQEYIEEKVDYARAYQSAANFLLSMLEPAYELVPTSFYEKHKADPEVELTGETRDEISLKRRDYFRKQYDELQADWKPLAFGRPQFMQVMAYALEKGKKAKKPISEHRLWLGAAQGFLYALDPHSSLVSRKAWDDSTKETQDSSFDGIGALLTQRFEPARTLRNRLKGKTEWLKKGDAYLLVQLEEEDKLRRRTFVESPMAGQPAEKAGVWAGDEIMKVDGTSVVDMPLDKVVSMIRGKSGTKVKLTLLREGLPGETVLEVTRSRIRVTNVEGRLLDKYPCLGYVKLTGFIETSFTNMQKEIERLNEQCSEGEGLRGLIFDLRNNSGGLLSQGVRIADLFLESGTIVTVKNRRKTAFPFLGGDETYSASKEDTVALPLVVLVNDGSASASEIVASALQDNKRGLIVGERTFGKASVQTLITPQRGKDYYVKLTIARYYAPSGRTLQVVGVKPDVDVSPEIDKPAPLGFREEDLSNHLPKIDSDYVSANATLLPELQECEKKRGIAEKIHHDDPHPQIKFDFQLYKGADYLECLAQREHGKESEVVDIDPASNPDR